MPTTVPTWQHGDYPTAALLNKYVTTINEAHAVVKDAAFGIGALDVSESVFFLIHVHRYLHFSSTGKLVDITGANEDISLSEGDKGYGVVDLDTVTWLGRGMLYQVTGVTFCLEHWEP